MPDISMCKGENCSLKEHCHRYKATPCEYRQAYFVSPPYVVEFGGDSCDYYWPTDYEQTTEETSD